MIMFNDLGKFILEHLENKYVFPHQYYLHSESNDSKLVSIESVT